LGIDLALVLRVLNIAGQECDLRLQKIISINGEPFGGHIPIDPVNLAARLTIIENFIGEQLSQHQPQPESCSVELPLTSAGPSQLPGQTLEQHPSPVVLPEASSPEFQDLADLVKP